MRLIKPLTAVTLAASLVLTGCSGSGSPSSSSAGSLPASVDGYPLSVDNCGHSLTITKAPERIVTLNQSSTEIHLSLGLADRMVGTATWTDPILDSLKAENEKVPRLADNNASLEAILATNPDFVAASFPHTYSDKSSGSFEKYSSLGIPAYLAPNQCNKGKDGNGDSVPETPFTIDKIYREIEDLSTIHNVRDKGAELVTSLKSRFAKAIENTYDGKIKVVFWFANSEAPYVAGGGGASQFVSNEMGLKNAYAHLPSEWPQVSWEDIAATNPDILVIGDLTRKSQTAETATAKIEYLESNPVTAQMDAVKNKRFVRVAGADMNPSIRTVDLAEKLAKAIDEFGLK